MFGGTNVGNASHEEWKWRRKIFAPKFTTKALESLTEYMQLQISDLDFESSTLSLDIKCMNLKIMMFHLFEATPESLGLTKEQVIEMIHDMIILGDYMDYLPRLIPIIGHSHLSNKFKHAGGRIRQTIGSLIDISLCTSNPSILREYMEVTEDRDALVCDLHALLLGTHDKFNFI